MDPLCEGEYSGLKLVLLDGDPEGAGPCFSLWLSAGHHSSVLGPPRGASQPWGQVAVS